MDYASIWTLENISDIRFYIPLNVPLKSNDSRGEIVRRESNLFPIVDEPGDNIG